MLLLSKRWKHFAAMALIGDGVMAVVRPHRDAEAWIAGPRLWRALMRELSRRPALTKLVGAMQVAGGVYWALSQEREKS